MSDKGYDSFQGVYRIAEAAENLDLRIVEVLTLHFAIEREIDRFLEKFVLRASQIRSLGYANKVKLLHAVWPEAKTVDGVCLVLNSFGELRNHLAHGNSTGATKHHDNLVRAYRAIEAGAPADIGYVYIAQGICSFLGGGPTPAEMKQLFKGLADIVAAMPNAPEAIRK